MSLRKFASVLVGLGLVVGLMGAGIGASFTDSATATTSITVGTFGLQITSTTSDAVVVNTGTPQAGNNVHTVTYTCPTITSSAPGNCPLQLTLTNTGTIDMIVAVSWNTVATPFQAIPVLNSYSIAAGGHQDLNAGILWAQQLTNVNLGQSVSITYTFSATSA